ncbi:hypothetical protein [Streptomyces sp. NPDC049555]|uniref:hypothetical protein n=1 Tax=unclassified Streptomyces TaxID=2593676 RepID=UPI00343E4BA1
MSSGAAHSLAERIAQIDWHGNLEHTRSRVALAREFFRRSALWAESLSSNEWPFFDIAALVDSSIRADEELVRKVSSTPAHQQPVVVNTCVWAVHFAELAADHPSLPELPDPFEPLLVMYERGGGVALDSTGFIDIDTAAVPIGSPAKHLERKPLPVHDNEYLDSLDGI